MVVTCHKLVQKCAIYQGCIDRVWIFGFLYVAVSGVLCQGFAWGYFRWTASLGCQQVRQPHWPSGKASALRAADAGLILVFAVDLFPGQAIPLTGKLVLQLLPCQVPGATGSALGLVCRLSVCCD